MYQGQREYFKQRIVLMTLASEIKRLRKKLKKTLLPNYKINIEISWLMEVQKKIYKNCNKYNREEAKTIN